MSGEGAVTATGEGAGAALLVLAFIRSTWRRWTDRHDGRIADELKELRHDVNSRIDKLEEQLTAQATTSNDTRDRVIALEAVVYDREIRGGRPATAPRARRIPD